MKVNPLYKVIFSVLITLLLLPFNSCKSDDDYIPYVPVNLSFNLTVFNELTITGSSTLFDKDGYGGVIVYCQFYDIVNPSQSVYYAYDATCTFEIDLGCTVVNEGENLTATCPCCKSEYSLFDGYPYKGEASKGLKTYNTSVFNDMLRIYN